MRVAEVLDTHLLVKTDSLHLSPGEEEESTRSDAQVLIVHAEVGIA